MSTFDSTGNPVPAIKATSSLNNKQTVDVWANPVTRALLVETQNYFTSTTATITSIASSTNSVTLLASNANRKGATIVNDSSAILYVKLGTTASTSSYTVALPASGSSSFNYYEVPFGYTGIIDGIWASANGSARVTELT